MDHRIWFVGVSTLLVLSCTLTCVHCQDSFMLGGQEAPLAQYPWQASLQLRAGGTHVCGAVILNKHWLMTAAHCVSILPRYLQVTVGVHSLKQTTIGQPVTHHVDKIIQHPDFTSNATGFSHDIALIHTETEIKPTVFTQFARLPEMSTPVSKSCWVSGWGEIIDASTKRVTVGPEEIVDGPYIAVTSEHHNTIPDPGDYIPVTGTVKEIEAYIRKPGSVTAVVWRHHSDKFKYKVVYEKTVKVTEVGRQSLAFSTAVEKGDIIGVTVGMQIVPYRLRQNCQKSTLVNPAKSESGIFTFTTLYDNPCRVYAWRGIVEVSPSASELSDTLQHSKVRVTATTKEQIVAEGVDSVPCLGDDGGALNCHHWDEIHVAGLYSYSRGTCRPEDPTAVYTDVLYHKEWITENIS